MRSKNSHSVSRKDTVGIDAQRVIDIAIASFALVVFAPLMCLIAVAVSVESGFPILYEQMRFGRFGQSFHMYKFRKLSPNCGNSGGPLTLENDERLTIVGRLLRATKLDELPQFWNVLIGDMSIVGPRPETLNFGDCFDGRYKAVLDYKPGIFGPSQVAFRDESQYFPENEDLEDFYRAVLFPAKAHLDLEYYVRRTLWMDLCWMLRGTMAVFGLRGADAGNALTAMALSERSPTKIGLARHEARPSMDGETPIVVANLAELPKGPTAVHAVHRWETKCLNPPDVPDGAAARFLGRHKDSPISLEDRQ